MGAGLIFTGLILLAIFIYGLIFDLAGKPWAALAVVGYAAVMSIAAGIGIFLGDDMLPDSETDSDIDTRLPADPPPQLPKDLGLRFVVTFNKHREFWEVTSYLPRESTEIGEHDRAILWETQKRSFADQDEAILWAKQAAIRAQDHSRPDEVIEVVWCDKYGNVRGRWGVKG